MLSFFGNGVDRDQCRFRVVKLPLTAINVVFAFARRRCSPTMPFSPLRDAAVALQCHFRLCETLLTAINAVFPSRRRRCRPTTTFRRRRPPFFMVRLLLHYTLLYIYRVCVIFSGSVRIAHQADGTGPHAVTDSVRVVAVIQVKADAVGTFLEVCVFVSLGRPVEDI